MRGEVWPFALVGMRHMCVVIASFYDGLPTQCFCFGSQAIFKHRPPRESCSPSVLWLQRLSWIESVHCVWQTGDLVVGSELAFSVDKLHHKDTATSSATPRQALQESRMCWSSFSVCALVLSRVCSSVCTPGTVSLCPCI